mgnify:CR=1 FL=1
MENKAQDKKEDKLILGGHEFNSRFILGSGKYNVNLIKAAVEQGGAEIITLALRRANTENKENILDFIPKGVTLLPNTSGARNAEEAVRIARLSREMGCGDFVKIEITRLILERFGHFLFVIIRFQNYRKESFEIRLSEIRAFEFDFLIMRLD